MTVKMRNPQFLGRLLSMMRKDRGLDQAEFASITGLKKPSLSRIENGLSMPRQATLEKLARALGLHVADLFDEAQLARLEQKRTGDSNATPFDYSAPPIWEVIAEIGRSIPRSEWDKVPRDASSNLDHYLYGHPKR